MGRRPFPIFDGTCGFRDGEPEVVVEWLDGITKQLEQYGVDEGTILGA
ncbi:hypothetical protein [Rhizobium sp. GR12]